MLQLGGIAEAKALTLKSVAGAAIMNTLFEECASVESIFCRLKQKFPDIIDPSVKMIREDRRAAWNIYPNVNDWLDMAKSELITTWLAEDKPMKVVDIFREAGVEPPFFIPGE